MVPDWISSGEYWDGERNKQAIKSAWFANDLPSLLSLHVHAVTCMTPLHVGALVRDHNSTVLDSAQVQNKKMVSVPDSLQFKHKTRDSRWTHTASVQGNCETSMIGSSIGIPAA